MSRSALTRGSKAASCTSWQRLGSRLLSSLVLAEHYDDRLLAPSLHTITAATKLDGDVTVLVAGQCIDAAAQAASCVQGVKTVLTADDATLQHQLAEPMADLLVAVQQRRKFSHVWAPSTTFGRNILPRAAALLDAQQVSDVVEVCNADTFKRPIYAGNAVQMVQLQGAQPRMLTVRLTAFDAAATSPATQAEIVPVDAAELQAAQDCRYSSTWVSASTPQSERAELSAAKVVVSGGRALKTKENFKLLEAIADRLGGAVGASRAAVDAGLCPNAMQVGQTGKIVAPDLYIAVGISGAIQHVAGMKDSRCIVAINSDADAPIFQIADYGLVADLLQALPELQAQLDKQPS